MIVAIVGGTNIATKDFVRSCIEDCHYPIIEVLTTEDEGVAQIVQEYCKEKNILYRIFSPDRYNLDAPGAERRRDIKTGVFYNGRAGVDRNQKLVDEAEAFVIIWDGVSPGIADIIRRIDKLPIQKLVYKVKTSR